LLFPKDVSLVEAHRTATQIERVIETSLEPRAFVTTHLERNSFKRSAALRNGLPELHFPEGPVFSNSIRINQPPECGVNRVAIIPLPGSETASRLVTDLLRR
jgi:hypothetical protein